MLDHKPALDRTSLELASSIYNNPAAKSRDKSHRPRKDSGIRNSFNNIIINLTGRDHELPFRSSSTLDIDDERYRFRRKAQSSEQNNRRRFRTRLAGKEQPVLQRLKAVILKFEERF